MTTLYCASWIVPICSSPIKDGAIAVDYEHIKAVGPRDLVTEQFPSAQIQNFPDAAILPGFVNAHSHLELTAMRGFLDNEETDFGAWLKKLTIARQTRMTTDDLYVSAAWGACEAIRAGVTCVGDAATAGFESMNAVRDVGLRGTVFQESFGPDARLAHDNLATLTQQVLRLRKLENSRMRAGVSPHAPYTVSAPQLELIADFAKREQLPVMMHAAESHAEDLLLREGRGPFAEGLAARGISWTAKSVSTIRYLEQVHILETKPLLAHCINVDTQDIQSIAASGACVAHCPKSNARLGHGRAPLLELLRHKVVVGLGSDSVASNNTCDLLEEARFAMLIARIGAGDKTLTTSEAIRLATVGGARALAPCGPVGELSPGSPADFAVVSLASTHQRPMYDPAATILNSSSGRDVLMTVVAGREVFREGRVTTADEVDLGERVKQVALKLIA